MNDPQYPEHAREADARYERDTRSQPDFIDSAHAQAEEATEQIAPSLGPNREAASISPRESSPSILPSAATTPPASSRIVAPSPASVSVNSTSATPEPRRETLKAQIARETYEGDDVERLRQEIERTRAEMSRTIDAIQDKASPEKLKERAVAQARAKTVGVVATGLERGAALAGKVADFARRFAASRQTKPKSPSQPATSADAEKTGLTLGSSYNADNPQLPAREPSEIATAGKQFGTVKTGSFLKPLSEQVVLVFGASSGIGRATALEMGKRGAKLVVVARDQRGLDSLVVDIGHVGSEASAFVADAADYAQVQAAAAHAVAAFGRLDTWVHVAAVSIYAKAEETTPDEYRRVLDVNVMGVIHGALAALPHIKREGRGAFIAISSVEGYRAFPYQAAYSASKHAVLGFMDSLRVETMHDGWPIAITSVLPAGINTPFFEKARTKLGVKPMPAPPIYQPHVVAEVILYASEHPTREITAGGGAQIIIALNKLAPGLVDRGIIARNAGFEGQKTQEARDVSHPDNLDGPLDGNFYHIGGDFTAQAKKKSVGNWLETHPIPRRAIFGGVTLLALIWLRNVGRRG